METKIATSIYWKKQVKFILGIDIMITIAVVVCSILNKDLEMFIVLGSCVLVYILCSLFLTYSARRLLTDVILNETGFQSVLFNKKIAFVNNQRTVYYAIFEEAEGVYSRNKFILVSNTTFKYIPRKSIFSKNIVGSYDINTQILIPYNRDTAKFFDFGKWICVG